VLAACLPVAGRLIAEGARPDLMMSGMILVFAAALVRRPWGIAVGSGLQVAFLATGILIVTMFLVAALFIAVWLRVLMFRHEVVGSPGGLRMLAG